MDNIEKFLRKLSPKEYEAILLLMMQLRDDYKKVPGIKKLIGKENMYRARCGRYRIIFIVRAEGIEIIRITKRNERTYKDI